MDNKKKRFPWRKAKAKKSIRGSISVLLCLLITPFLTVTLGLIEYARYQEVMEIADELVELTDMFALGDYDPYIHHRFGLLALSQQDGLGDGLDSTLTNVLSENAKITGDQLVPSFVQASGKFALQETSVLTRQITDLGQLTVPAAVAFENLKLDKLLEKLNSLQSFTKITDTVGQIAAATDKVTEAVKAVQAVQTDLDKLKNAINGVKNKGNSLLNDFSKLVQTLGELDITLPSSATPEDIQATIQQFMDSEDGSESLLDQIKSIYAQAKELTNDLKGLKNTASTLLADAKKVPQAVKDAGDAVKSIGKNTNPKQSQDPSAAPTQSLEEIVSEMQEVVDGTLKTITDDSIETVKKAADDIIDKVFDSTGLSSVHALKKFNSSYFSLPLSDAAKEDITSFAKMAYTAYNEAKSSGGNVGQQLLNKFKDNFVPKINFECSSISKSIQDILDKAGSTLNEKVSGSFTAMIEKLAKVARAIFKFEAFYNPALNAVVTFADDADSPNQKFLDAVKTLLGAVDTFKEKSLHLDVLGALKAMGDMFSAIKDMLLAIFKRVGQLVDSIGELTKGMGAIYDRLVVSGYMVHNLPCRLNYDGLSKGSVALTGTSMMGFDYQDIPRGDNLFKGAELEYIYAGTNEEIANQQFTFWDIYFLRLLVNLPTIFMDAEVGSIAAAANVGAWVIYILYILIEPFLDTLLLVNNTTLPLIKKNCWLTAIGIEDYVDRLVKQVTNCDEIRDAANDLVADLKSNAGEHPSKGNDPNEGGEAFELGYQDYMLLILALLVPTEDQVQRLGNLVDLEATQYYADHGSKSFSMEKTYTAVTVRAEMSFHSFFDLGLLAGDGPLDLSSTVTHTVSY